MREPRNICRIIGGLGGVPLGGIEGINISAGGAPPNVPVTTKIEIFESPAPPPPPPVVPPELGSQVSAGQFGTIAGGVSIGGFIAQAIENLNPFPTLRAQPIAVSPGTGELRPQPFEVPMLDLGFRPQPSGQVTGEIQTLKTGREFRPSQEIQTLDQGGHGGELQTGVRRETLRTVETTGGQQQTLETIEQSRQQFQSGHFQDPPGELDYVAQPPGRLGSPPDAAAKATGSGCATCSMLNSDPNATDSFPVEMIFHFKNHASAQRLGGLCEADGECEIA